ncbi:MAG: 2-oxoglutarate dehydrogenase complex dihydrolipoyllysine-residue succinyltransferase [Hyphomicrobiales bacterium]
MKTEIKVPSLGESISEVQIASWLVEEGEYVSQDTEIAEIDSDKATLSVPSSADGTIHILVPEGETISIGTVIATIDTEATATKKETANASKADTTEDSIKLQEENAKEAKPEIIKNEPQEETIKAEENTESQESSSLKLSPLAKKVLKASNSSEKELQDFFTKIKITKEDVDFFIRNKDNTKELTTEAPKDISRNKKATKMTSLRKKLSERLVSVKNETAMLTTFNEINMTPIMNLRNEYKNAFMEKHNIRLGYMSFFTKAVSIALKHFPQVNSMIDGDNIISFDYCDIGIAVSAPKGLMVPIIRNTENMSLAEIETAVRSLAEKARNNKITLEEMSGGTFTITNGGLFGSMLSTPIINPPQSAILGMHNIIERPIAVNGKVEIHPIMYVALSYDHRVVDGKDSVGFLLKVKELIEHPERMIFNGEDANKLLLDL